MSNFASLNITSMQMKMEIMASSFKNILNPNYQIEFGLTREIDSATMQSAVKGVNNRFPGMKIIPASSSTSSFRTNVRIVIPTEQLVALAHTRGCTTTEFLATLVKSAQQAAYDSSFVKTGSRPKLYVSVSPSILSSYMLLGAGGMRRHSVIPALGRNSRTFCDLGEVYLPDDVAEAVRSVDFRILRQAGRGNACTAVNFGGRTIINCSRRIREHKFEYFFIEELRAAGLDACVEPSLGCAQQFPQIVKMAYSAL